MKKTGKWLFILGCLFFVSRVLIAAPLPSWQGKPKQQILDFVAKVTQKDSKDFVPLDARVAVFDNDGTLWPEQPMYFQFIFALDRVKALASTHPEWKEKQPFKGILENDMTILKSLDEKAIAEIVMVTHAGMSTQDFENIVTQWIKTARHPRFQVSYPELAYQPMLELLQYLRENQFKIFIVSGGGVEFMRPWVPKTYGISPENVIGSSIKVKYEFKDGKPLLMRLPEIFFIDDKSGKPVAINSHIGVRPIMAFGNSDGDQQMLEWTTINNDKPHLAMIVHHDDDKREWAYDRKSPVGQLNTALDAASKYGWTLISMKNDWKKIFAFVTDE